MPSPALSLLTSRTEAPIAARIQVPHALRYQTPPLSKAGPSTGGGLYDHDVHERVVHLHNRERLSRPRSKHHGRVHFRDKLPRKRPFSPRSRSRASIARRLG